MKADATNRPVLAASGVMETPSINAAPTVSEIAPPCAMAPAAARIPTRNAARIVETAFAPIAGAKGGELLFAPNDHAMNRQLTVANPTRTQNKAAIIPCSTSRYISGGDCVQTAFATAPNRLPASDAVLY